MYPYKNDYSDEELEFIEKYLKTECGHYTTIGEALKVIQWGKDRNLEEHYMTQYAGKFVRIEKGTYTWTGLIESISISNPSMTIRSKYFLEIKETKISFENRKEANCVTLDVANIKITEITREEFEEYLITEINYVY